MKPRNKFQKSIMALSEKLPKLTQHQKDYAFKHAVVEYGYATRKDKQAWCSHCGGSFEYFNQDLSVPGKRDEIYVKCPHCGTRIKMILSRAMTDDQLKMFTITTVAGGYQVIRFFSINYGCRIGRPYFYGISEVVQQYLDSDFKIVAIVARPRSLYSSKYWRLNAPLSFKVPPKYVSYYSISPYDERLKSHACWPYSRVLPILKRNGFKPALLSMGLAVNDVIESLLHDNYAETLVKTNQLDIFSYMLRGGEHDLKRYAYALKIAHRNHYTISSIDIYIDYIKLLAYFDLDLHSPHYLCPKNLKEQHDKLMKRKNRIEGAKERERKAKEAFKLENKYHQAKAPFMGIDLGDSEISIKLIPSVAAMKEEGDAMHHCVFKAQYYKKDNSLIFSAKDMNGKRLETIEVSLSALQVMQCHGHCNENSEYHEQILKLVNSHMYMIEKIKREIA